MSSNLDLVFRPVVTLEDGIVRAYRAVPVNHSTEGVAYGAKAVMPEEDDPIDTASHNEQVMSLAVAAIETAHAAGHDVSLLVPVNAAGMASDQASEAMTEMFNELSPLCKGAIVPTLFNLPDDLTVDAMDDIVIPFIMSIDKFIVVPPAILTDYMTIGACNAAGVVLDMFNDPELDMGEVAMRAAMRQLPLYIFDVAQSDDVHRASENGAACIDGAAFGKHLKDIGPETNGPGIAALETVDLE
jgi:hypothetical protein